MLRLNINKLNYEYNNESQQATQNQDLTASFKQILKLDKNSAKSQAEKLLAENDAHKEQLQKSKSELKQLQTSNWQLKSNIKANQYLQRDFEHYVSKVFKEPPAEIIKKWQHATNKTNLAQLGNLRGVGVGK